MRCAFFKSLYKFLCACKNQLKYFLGGWEYICVCVWRFGQNKICKISNIHTYKYTYKAISVCLCACYSVSRFFFLFSAFHPVKYRNTLCIDVLLHHTTHTNLHIFVGLSVCVHMYVCILCYICMNAQIYEIQIPTTFNQIENFYLQYLNAIFSKQEKTLILNNIFEWW